MGAELMAGVFVVLAAVVTAGPTYLAWVTRKENLSQHAEGRACTAALAGKVDLVHSDVKEVRDKVVEHLADKEAHAPR